MTKAIIPQSKRAVYIEIINHGTNKPCKYNFLPQGIFKTIEYVYQKKTYIGEIIGKNERGLLIRSAEGCY